MTSSVYTILSKQIASLNTLDVISNNISHTEDGFKKDFVLFGKHIINTGHEKHQNPYTEKTVPNWEAGPIKVTGRNLDLAIQNTQDAYGFFMIRTEDGVKYTRAGHISKTTSGKLIDAKGNAVLSQDLQDIIIDANEGEMKILADGTIVSGDDELGQIGIAAFAREDLAHINKSHDGYMQTKLEPQYTPSITLLQQAIEESNANMVTELSRLMEVQREISMAQGLNQGIDATYRAAYQAVSQL